MKVHGDLTKPGARAGVLRRLWGKRDGAEERDGAERHDGAEGLVGRDVYIVLYKLGTGGRTGAVLDQCEAFVELGMNPVIVTFDFETDRERAMASALSGRELPAGTSVVNLHEELSRCDQEAGAAGLPEADGADGAELSFASHSEGDTTLLSYFDRRGRCVRVRQERDGLVERDTLFREGVPYLVRDFDTRGHCSRERSVVGAVDRVSEERYFARDGFCYVTRRLDAATGAQRGNFWHRRGERESRRYAHNTPWHAAWLEEFVRSREHEAGKPFVIAESPSSVLKLLDTGASFAHRLYMFHENHLAAPHTLGADVRKDYGSAPERMSEMPLLIVPTEAQAEDIRTQFGAEVRVRSIGNRVIDKRTRAARTKEAGRIGSFGRLAASKRLDEALRIFRGVVERVPGARFEIYGSGPERKKLEKLAGRLGLDDAVTFHGRTPDVGDEMARCAVTISTSATESFGLSIAESLAVGTPVVSYAVNYGPRDLIRDGRDGYLIEPGDEEGFVDKVVELLGDPAAAQRMGEDGERRMAEDFSRRSFTAAWKAAFLEAEAVERAERTR